MKGPLVVLGDALLDIDLDGTAARLAPDCPAPVLDELEENPRPGGAALAAVMAARDGHRVILVTALGDDEAGRRVEQLVDGVQVVRLGYDGPTPVKTRVRASGRSLVRLDTGTGAGTVTSVPDEVGPMLAEASAVLVADYGRGVTSSPELRRLLSDVVAHVPVVWDPHPRGAAPVPGVRLATPNEGETKTFAAAAPGSQTGANRLAEVALRAERLIADWQARAVAVTLGERGALLSYGSGAPVVTPAPSVSAVDPCGAGDRFAVTAAIALGSGQVTTEAVGAAVADAAAYVGAGGPASLVSREPRMAPITGVEATEQLVRRTKQRGGVVVATGGCFDLLHAGHVATLRAARRLGDCLVVCLNSDESVRRLKGPTRPLVPAEDRARVLEALECVDAVVVFEEDTPVEVIRRLRPDVWAKGGDYAGADVPEAAVLAEWRGQAVVLPYLQDHSTTRLLADAVRGAGGSDLTSQT